MGRRGRQWPGLDLMRGALELQNQVNDKDEGRYEPNRKEKAREDERQRAVGSKISLSARFRLNANGSRHDAQNKLKQTGWTAFRVLT